MYVLFIMHKVLRMGTRSEFGLVKEESIANLKK
jgi:hypothetical protein